MAKKDWTESQLEQDPSDLFRGLAGRRKKAAFLLIAIWFVIFALHSVAWGFIVIAALSAIVSIQLIRLLIAKAKKNIADIQIDSYPFVSLLASAKNEEAVIESLVNQLGSLDYPADKYEIWIVDDNSTDKTSSILDGLAASYPQLKVLHRPYGSSGGKSGALNEVFLLSQGSIIGVFDADARIDSSLLKRVVPLFAPDDIGAVQLRKSILNWDFNFLTKGQSAEMALDSFYQLKRIASGGLGELRGNGQFVRRRALESTGGWNEETITDDLDLTIRLHLDNWKIDFCLDPQVEEEGVTSLKALWHQRNRWAEGGYQRYLDYWRLLLSKPMGLKKKLDLFTFLLVQYIVPTAAIPDLLLSWFHHQPLLLAPLTSLIFTFSFFGMWKGLKDTTEKASSFQLLLAAVGGMIYMVHWFVIIPFITLRISLLPKTLKWVKTSHKGEDLLELLN